MTVVSTAAPAKYATEAFTWSSTAIVTGIGAGMAIAGVLVERVGPPAPFGFAAASVFTAAFLALRVRNA
jgi:predicted MFS family arabinose efflux permease